MILTFFVIGVILFTAGVAFIYWPAALICLGILLMFFAVRMSTATEAVKPSSDK